MANKTTNLNLTLTNDTDATTTTFKQWRESINGETDSNMQKIDDFAGNTNISLTNKVDKDTNNTLKGTNTFNGEVFIRTPSQDYQPATKKYVDDKTLKNLRDTTVVGDVGKASLYMDNTNEVTTPAGGTTLHPDPVPSTTAPIATGTGSFAVGSGTKATGDVSVAEGILNEASGKASHAEGAGTKAGGNTSHAEGFYTEATGDYSYAGNYGTIASGKKSHAEGGQTKAIGNCTHAEGDSTTAQGTGSHAEGAYTFANGEYSHAEGCGNNFEGADQKLIAGGTGAHAEGFITKAMGNYSHAEGMNTQTSGQAAHAEGFNTTAINKSHAEGEDTLAGGDADNNRAAHAEGLRTTATGAGSHAEGGDTIASGRYSHAEGRKSTTGEIKTTASGEASHAEGIGTTASGYDSHAEGGLTTASGTHSHAEGYGTIADGVASHAGGISTIAQWDNSTVIGKFNKTTDLSNSNSGPLFIVGNGTSHTHRKNALEIYADGTGVLNEGAILTENTYYVDWGTLTGNRDTTVMTTTDVTVKDKNNSAVTLIDFYNKLSTLLSTNKNDIRIVLKGLLPITDDPANPLEVKCVATSVTKALTIIQVSALAGYYYDSSARASANISIKLNITFANTTSATAELIVYTYSEAPNTPCLIEGTKITMSDSTTKPVEEVKAGDIVLSYNPVTKEKTNAVVLACYLTGRSNKFDVYSFENGKHLTAFGIHGFYANELGYVKNIQDINKKNELVDENLETTYLIVKRSMMFHGECKARYNIITSNNLYFANGILLGHSPWQKGQYYINRGLSTPSVVKEIYKEEIDRYNAYQSFMDSPEYHAEVAEQYAKLANAVNEIKIYKDKLAATDYKVQKYTEGVLSEEEWQEAKTNRAAWRQAVNDNEQLRNESKKLVDNIIAKYRNGVTMRQLFEESCTKDNESFETIKNYFEVK